jgi:hypothetical protein
MKQRNYYYITGTSQTGYQMQKVTIDSEDLYDREIVTLAFHIGELAHADQLLKMVGLRSDTAYFYDQCRSVISVSESHINAKGEGKFAFRANFHNFPDSVIHINDRAILVVSLEPKDEVSPDGLRDYWAVGYVHANIFDFRDAKGDLQEGFYYNMLRVSERANENGIKVYRRKKIFTMIFSVLHSLTEVYGMHFAYACMGKENQAIHDALVINSKKYDKHFETFPIRTNTKFNKLFGSGSAAAKLVDISRNKEKLKEMFKMLQDQKKDYVYHSVHSEDLFLKLIDNILKYSTTSKVYMIPDSNGNIASACIALNLGDYFALTLDNPQGFFKFLAGLKLTDRLLYPIHIVGEEKPAQELLKGIAYKYLKDHKVYLSIINSYGGDRYSKVKKGLLYDDYIFFIITDRLDQYHAIKEQSKLDGVPRFFVDNPIM